MNEFIKDHLNSIQKILMSEFKAESRCSSASKGRSREIFVKNFLEAVVPNLLDLVTEI